MKQGVPMLTGRAAAFLIVLVLAAGCVLATHAAAVEPTCETVEALATQPQGEVLALVGPAGDCAAPAVRSAQRFRLDGTADSSFGRKGTVSIDSQPILFGTDGRGRLMVVTPAEARRYTPRGRPDRTFGANGVVDFGGLTASSAVAEPDGGLLIASVSQNPEVRVTVGRFDPSGTVDSAFGGGTVSVAFAGLGDGRQVPRLASLDDGRVVVGGPGGLLSLLPNGSVDASFGNGGEAAFPPFERESLSTLLGLVPRPGGQVLALSAGIDMQADVPFTARKGRTGQDLRYLTYGRTGGIESSHQTGYVMERRSLFSLGGSGSFGFMTTPAPEPYAPEPEVLDLGFSWGGTVPPQASTRFVLPSGGNASAVSALAVAPDGALLIGGNVAAEACASPDGTLHRCARGPVLFRLKPGGGIDASFGEGGTAAAGAVCRFGSPVLATAGFQCPRRIPKPKVSAELSPAGAVTIEVVDRGRHGSRKSVGIRLPRGVRLTGAAAVRSRVAVNGVPRRGKTIAFGPRSISVRGLVGEGRRLRVRLSPRAVRPTGRPIGGGFRILSTYSWLERPFPTSRGFARLKVTRP